MVGLGNINPNSISDLSIYNNSQLAECDILSICEYLITPGGIIEIFNNASGCNSQQEVQEDCLTEIMELTNKIHCAISPNPCLNKVIIRISNIGKQTMSLDLVQVSGVCVKQLINEVKQPGNYEMIIDLNDFPKGVYILIIKTNNELITKKLIKL